MCAVVEVCGVKGEVETEQLSPKKAGFSQKHHYIPNP